MITQIFHTETIRKYNSEIILLMLDCETLLFKPKKLQINSFVPLGFTGITFWMIDMDDFKGVSGYNYPLLYGIQSAFVSISSVTIMMRKALNSKKNTLCNFN